MEEKEKIMSVTDWLLTLIILMIPCVGLIMLLVWAFKPTEEYKTRSNYCKAALIVGVIVFVLSFVLSLLGLLPIMSAMMSTY